MTGNKGRIEAERLEAVAHSKEQLAKYEEMPGPYRVNWKIVSYQMDDHITYKAEIIGGVLIRHVEFANTTESNVLSVSICFVPERQK